MLVASLSLNPLWYLPPLVVTISLVYGATRHELMWPILEQSMRVAVWILGFMGIIAAVLGVVSWFS